MFKTENIRKKNNTYSITECEIRMLAIISNGFEM